MSIFKRGSVEPNHPTEPTTPVDSGVSSYSKLWNSIQIRDSWQDRAKRAAHLVLQGKERYKDVSHSSHVPWQLIGVIHLLEGDCSFRTHLHNGDPLSGRTRHVPKGRPVHGEPPFQWEVSAIDALSYDGIKPPLETIDEQFYALERFNGLGYRKKGINSPYLWSGSNHYLRGKYIADGHYDASAVSQQVGAAVVLKTLQALGEF